MLEPKKGAILSCYGSVYAAHASSSHSNDNTCRRRIWDIVGCAVFIRRRSLYLDPFLPIRKLDNGLGIDIFIFRIVSMRDPSGSLPRRPRGVPALCVRLQRRHTRATTYHTIITFLQQLTSDGDMNARSAVADRRCTHCV